MHVCAFTCLTNALVNILDQHVLYYLGFTQPAISYLCFAGPAALFLSSFYIFFGLSYFKVDEVLRWLRWLEHLKKLERLYFYISKTCTVSQLFSVYFQVQVPPVK